MMLIQDKHKIYMFDRDNSVFEINHLEFPYDVEYSRHLTNTLVDGVRILDFDHFEIVSYFFLID